MSQSAVSAPASVLTFPSYKLTSELAQYCLPAAGKDGVGRLIAQVRPAGT